MHTEISFTNSYLGDQEEGSVFKMDITGIVCEDTKVFKMWFSDRLWC